MCTAANWHFLNCRGSSGRGPLLPIMTGWRDMADITMGATTGAATEARPAPRLLFIDNIRWSMIILVLSMHACDTYSPFGNWYYVDRQKADLGTTLFFGVYQSFLQAFFMAALFFI